MIENVVHRLAKNLKSRRRCEIFFSLNETAASSRTCLCGYREGERDRRRKKKRIRGKNEKVTDAMRAT